MGFSLSVQALAWRKTSKTLGVPDYNYLWVCYFNSDLVNYSYVPQESYNMTGRESLQSWQIRTCRRWSMNDGCHDGMFCLYCTLFSFLSIFDLFLFCSFPLLFDLFLFLFLSFVLCIFICVLFQNKNQSININQINKCTSWHADMWCILAIA